MKITGENYRDETRLEHMLQALERITKTAETMSKDRLYFEDVVMRAIMYDFAVLGEAANNITNEYCLMHPEIEWAQIAGFRHKLIHDYAGVDYGVLWEAISTDVPKLLPQIRRLVSELTPVNELRQDLSEFK